jgi:hypothetical protein
MVRIAWHHLHYVCILASILLLDVVLSPSSASALNIPQPISPASDTTTTPDTDPPLGVPSFTWSPVPGAVIYRLQVDNDSTFNQPIFLDVTTHYLSYTPQSPDRLFVDGKWYWRVRVEDPSPVSEWSPVMQFTKAWATASNKPALLAPLQGQRITFFNAPVFSWTHVIGAASYRIQIASSSDGFNPPISSVDTIATSYQPNQHLANGIYYWRVLPQDVFGNLGTPSDSQSFISGYGTASSGMVPSLVSPVNESHSVFTPTFQWTAVEGGEHYVLQFTTNVNCDFDATNSSIETYQTSYTPVNIFLDGGYCWHVRVESGDAIGDWSETWHFQKKWDLKPILLTPVPHYQSALYPLYSWTPVPGAAEYLIQISLNSSFNTIYEQSTTANTTYTPQTRYLGTAHYYWRVRPIDSDGNAGEFSDVSDYQSVYTSAAPVLISPLYYYQPNVFSGIFVNPYEDRTAALPIFQWHRLIDPPPDGGSTTQAYRLQVDVTPYFNPPIWALDTENTSATPADNDNFIPIAGQDYYWRVCPLDHLGGNCLTKNDGVTSWWSQVWKARFDSNLGLESTAGEIPALLRPTPGQEIVEATPLLEWWPYQDATKYQVEVSREIDFSTHDISDTVYIPAFSPRDSLAQRSLGRTHYGTYYWRVRALTDNEWSGWSTAWRFQIASQSEWRYTRTPGSSLNKLIIGDDPVGDADSSYDLTSLFVSQASGYWYLGFNRIFSDLDMTYVFYLDIDNVDGSGAVSPPESACKVTTIPAHQPEYAIYLDVAKGEINQDHIMIFAWDGSLWKYGQTLASLGGSVYASDSYIELKLPDVSIGMGPETGSFSLILFSVDNFDGTVQDTVPSDPQVPGTSVLSHFSAVSDHLNQVSPPDTSSRDSFALPFMLPLFWDWPTGGDSSTPFAGFNLQVDLDPDFSQPHEASLSVNSDTTYLAENQISLLNDIAGDHAYYWRVQPRYWLTGHPEVDGAWAQGQEFNRVGLIPQNLHTSITFATPNFRWDVAEGAQAYRLQVATDASFGSKIIDVKTPMNSFTPTDSLLPGQYYWRVQIIRSGDITGGWSTIHQFYLSYPSTTGLLPDQKNIHDTPTLCWDPLVKNDNNKPVFAAWRYHVQVSTDPLFNSIFDQVDTDSNCWTPSKGYPDGAFYWRVAIIINNDNKLGNYSAVATFTKQYPASTLISPSYGRVASVPSLKWAAVDSAATYIYQISCYPSFSPFVDSGETINIQYTPTSMLGNDKVYFWRIAIRDKDGNQGPFSSTSFYLSNHIFIPIIYR